MSTANCDNCAHDLGTVQDFQRFKWFFNPDTQKSLFSAPAAGQLGNTGKGDFFGPRFIDIDMAFIKRIPIHEAINLEFRAGATNLTNTPSFGLPTATLASPDVRCQIGLPMRLHSISSLFLIPALLGFATASRADILYESNRNGMIERFASGGVFSVFASGLSSPFGLAFDRAANLFVANVGNDTILKFTPGGVGSVFASGLSFPQGLAFDSAGNLYAANDGNNTIEKFTPEGVSSLFTDGSHSVGNPTFLAFTDDQGNPLLLANQVAPVPEPSTWAIFTLSGMALLLAKRWTGTGASAIFNSERRLLLQPAKPADGFAAVQVHRVSLRWA